MSNYNQYTSHNQYTGEPYQQHQQQQYTFYQQPQQNNGGYIN